ncbi:ligase-associated DNA damage response endonuclease PdeM [Sandaracinobacter neustonicus]|uniref:Ligase-associated DNA damage response endonuclease PdeM n=1 Tax=Sandaracinobacter neustonicus TaxID=1715348 RepID=A0A501XKR8_9SPHN|nr:ligase-associated DNA damage response endonuclease PdeM [Sandaracinobacter neustonicus]TPE61045.1 ligase-associated DNA damage response endonuclease PdeM [Sandaracinobacter neustonicus]
MGDVSLSFPLLQLGDSRFRALPCGALFWEEEQMLLVADLHLEKGSAFAAKGWLLPPHDSQDTLQRLLTAVRRTGARRVAALGDSFHDQRGAGRLPGPARELLSQLFEAADWLWITGNHDGDSGAGLGGTAEVELQLRGIWLRHEAEPGCTAPEISGHFHPKVRVPLRGGRQVARRCMARAGDRLVLPAYGAYAGGLFVDDPAFVQALGRAPDALVALEQGFVQVNAAKGEMVE